MSSLAQGELLPGHFNRVKKHREQNKPFDYAEITARGRKYQAMTGPGLRLHSGTG